MTVSNDDPDKTDAEQRQGARLGNKRNVRDSGVAGRRITQSGELKGGNVNRDDAPSRRSKSRTTQGAIQVSGRVKRETDERVGRGLPVPASVSVPSKVAAPVALLMVKRLSKVGPPPPP